MSNFWGALQYYKTGFLQKKEYRDDKKSQNVSVNKKIEE